MAIFQRIADFNDAYENSSHIPGGDGYIERWQNDAAAFRAGLRGEGRIREGLAYGDGERNRYDLMLPKQAPRGLFVFVHGGYWVRFDRHFWSHFAQGPLERGFAVAMPSYTLCPDVRIADITREVAAAIAHVAKDIDGPVILSGHSAGGHLASRMMCADNVLDGSVRDRVQCLMSISGVHDLRPLMRLDRNAQLRIDETEAYLESPALLRPCDGTRLIAWVGAAERNEFLRQNALLANAWTGLGAEVLEVAEPDRHHFNVIDGLRNPDHGVLRAAFEGVC